MSLTDDRPLDVELASWRGEVTAELRATKERLTRIEEKIDQLMNARAKLYGAAAVIVVATGILQFSIGRL